MSPRENTGPTQTSANVRHSSASAEHYTPPEIIEASRATLGGIDLDPASCDLADGVVHADTYFDLSTDRVLSTLNRNWGSQASPWTVFLNPPGGRIDGNASTQKAWWFKLEREWRERRARAAIFVSFSIELLQTTQVNTPEGAGVPLDFPICFPSRRVAYYHDDGTGKLVAGKSPPHSSCIIYLPERIATGGAIQVWDGRMVDKFAKSFFGFGRVVVPR